mgnify:CR=1 FL=1
MQKNHSNHFYLEIREDMIFDEQRNQKRTANWQQCVSSSNISLCSTSIAAYFSAKQRPPNWRELWRFGEPIRAFIEKYLGILTVVFCVLLVGGFVALKYAL